MWNSPSARKTTEGIVSLPAFPMTVLDAQLQQQQTHSKSAPGVTPPPAPGPRPGHIGIPMGVVVRLASMASAPHPLGPPSSIPNPEPRGKYFRVVG